MAPLATAGGQKKAGSLLFLGEAKKLILLFHRWILQYHSFRVSSLFILSVLDFFYILRVRFATNLCKKCLKGFIASIVETATAWFSPLHSGRAAH